MPTTPRLDARTFAGPAERFLTTVDAAPRVKYELPELPPGVVPSTDPTVALAAGETPRMAMDFGGGFGPQYQWLNTFNTLGNGLAFLGYPYLAELAQISEYRAPSEVMATEMTRKWLEVVSKGSGDKSDKIEKLNAALDEFGVREKFRKAAMLDGLFGRCQVYMRIKGQDSDTARQLPLEIDPANIRVGGLLGLTVIEPYWTTPYSWNSNRPELEDFYKPQSYYVMGRKTHDSRFLSFIGREVPDLLKPAYNFGGISMTQLMKPYVDQWLRTRNSVSNLINAFSITTLATNLQSTLEDGTDGVSSQGLINRAAAFTRSRDNLGLALIQMGEEEIAQTNTPLSGLDALQAQSQEHMAAPCHIPLVKLFGVVPTGLNATSEGEIQVFYDFVNAYQENLFGRQIETLLKVLQCHLFGAIDEEITHRWIPLDEPTVKELSEIRASDATAGAGYINAGVISPDEERERLQSDPNSGYNNLNGPAPEPPQDVDADGNPIDPEAPTDEGDPEVDPSEEADKQREHESTENDLDRKHELKLAAKKKTAADAAFNEADHPRGKGGKFAVIQVSTGSNFGTHSTREHAEKRLARIINTSNGRQNASHYRIEETGAPPTAEAGAGGGEKELAASFKGKYQSDIRWLKASNKALRAFPSSPKQKKYQAEMRAIEEEYEARKKTAD